MGFPFIKEEDAGRAGLGMRKDEGKESGSRLEQLTPQTVFGHLTGHITKAWEGPG